jgi:hypothetical protein
VWDIRFSRWRVWRQLPSAWWRRQQSPLKRRWSSTRLHGPAYQLPSTHSCYETRNTAKSKKCHGTRCTAKWCTSVFFRGHAINRNLGTKSYPLPSQSTLRGEVHHGFLYVYEMFYKTSRHTSLHPQIYRCSYEINLMETLLTALKRIPWKYSH